MSQRHERTQCEPDDCPDCGRFMPSCVCEHEGTAWVAEVGDQTETFTALPFAAWAVAQAELESLLRQHRDDARDADDPYEESEIERVRRELAAADPDQPFEATAAELTYRLVCKEA